MEVWSQQKQMGVIGNSKELQEIGFDISGALKILISNISVDPTMNQTNVLYFL